MILQRLSRYSIELYSPAVLLHHLISTRLLVLITAMRSVQNWRLKLKFLRQMAIYMSPFTTRIGLVIVEDTGLGREIIQNYKDVGGDILAKTITPEAKTNFNGLYRNGDYGDVKEVFFASSKWVCRRS